MIRRDDPLGSIRAMAAAHNNWGRWGQDDVLGTLNFIDAAKRIEAAALVKTGEAFSLSQPFDTNGPQKGWRRRTNPVHTMTDTGVDAERGNQGFPHGFGGADDVIAMPLQCSTQWDGLGHIFDQGKAWNGRAAGDVVTSEGDLVTGIETAAAKIVTRGVLLDVGRALGPELGRNDGELPDGFAITPEHLQRTIELQGPSSKVRRGDIVVIRTGQYTRVRRDGLGRLRGRLGPRACPSARRRGCTAAKSPASPPTPGVSRSGPTNSTAPSSPCTRSPSPTLACSWARCGTRTASRKRARRTAGTTSCSPPHPFPSPGAVGSPVNPIAVR